MSRKFYTDIDLQTASGVVNARNGVNPQDLVTMSQLTSAIEGLAAKDNCRAASSGGNVTLGSPGANLDGVALVSGNRILLKDQTNAAENGIYVWSGASSALVRAFDGSANNDLLSAVTTIDEGTVNAGTTWRQTAVGIVLGTTALAWVPFGVVSPPASTTTAGIVQIATQAEVDAGVVANKVVTPQALNNYALRLKKYSVAIGDGSSTQFDITHNINSLNVQVQVYRSSSPYDNVEVDVERPSSNIARVRFAVAPAAGAYTVVVIG